MHSIRLLFALAALAASHASLALDPGSQTRSGVSLAPHETSAQTRRVSVRTVTPLPTENGSFDPATPQVVELGQSVSFAVIPDPGYAIGIIGGCDGNFDADTSTWTTGPISADCTVVATFVIQAESVLTPATQTARIGQSVRFDVAVEGSNAAPDDGRVTVVALPTGESCISTERSSVTGNIALFSCEISFKTLGARSMESTFDQSFTHTGSEAHAEQELRVMRFAGLSVTADDGMLTAAAGDTLEYLVEVRNAGPDDAPGTRVQVGINPALIDATWTCTAALGEASCPGASGSGTIFQIITQLPENSGLDYVYTGELGTLLPPAVVLQASVTADAFEPNVVINTTPAAGTAIDSNTVNVIFADSFE